MYKDTCYFNSICGYTYHYDYESEHQSTYTTIYNYRIIDVQFPDTAQAHPHHRVNILTGKIQRSF